MIWHDMAMAINLGEFQLKAKRRPNLLVIMFFFLRKGFAEVVRNCM